MTTYRPPHNRKNDPLKTDKSKMTAGGNNNNKMPAASAKLTKRVNVDIVTGKELVSVYFDPAKAIGLDPSRDADWHGLNFYTPAVVIKEENNVLTVRLNGGEVVKLSEATKVTDNDDEGVDDILKLRDFSEKSLVHTLRVRYQRDEIYTFVGPILISLNPYKSIRGIYDEFSMELYHDKRQGELPPHLFVIAENSHRFLMDSVVSGKAQSQSIIISGESGAGKTEATKVIMSYLARVASLDVTLKPADRGSIGGDREKVAAKDSIKLGELEQRVLNTNPILEAFGNARTLRNDNSSRFGKFIKIHFAKSGKITGASIEKYLLEKTRLVHQIPGERNFHIFYQLLKGGDEELLNALHLTKSLEDYLYTGSSIEASNIPNVSDEAEFQVVIECLKSICDDNMLLNNIFRLLSGILHLGNVEFNEKDETEVGKVKEETLHHLHHAAALFGIETDDLVTALTKQNMYVNNAVIVKVQNHAQAIDKKHSFAKSVYSMLFSWMVDKINTTISSKDKQSWGFIGLLDIYGFENFENMNSFEQLLINYANEKMQNHFNKHIFFIEQAEYESEGIDWSYIKFYDNQPCVELIDGKPSGKSGILQTLDDSGSSARQDPNASFLANLNVAWSGSSGGTKHPNYVAPRFNSDQKFGIMHYAGEVFYEIAGFVEKNREATNNDMKEIMAKSSNDLLRSIAEDLIGFDNAREASNALISSSNGFSSKNVSRKPSVTGRTAQVSKLKEDSISKQFINSLKQLFDTLESTQPHFVRCVKPNVYKRANYYHAKDTLQQLKYSGMLEAIRIRQQGYALRINHEEFFEKYHRLAPFCPNLKELVKYLSQELAVSNESWQLGTTKIFIRRDLSEKLDRLLWLTYSCSARKIQTLWRFITLNRKVSKAQALIRAFVAKRKYRRFRVVVILLQARFRKRVQRFTFLFLRSQMVRIQTGIRGKLARNELKKLKNPYNRMGYDELMSHYRTCTHDLHAAFETNDFAQCAQLEHKIEDIKNALAKNLIPLREVKSRDEADLFLQEVRFAVDSLGEAPDAKALSHYESLRAEYEKVRAQFPTLDEIKSRIESTQKDLKVAMSAKQFKVCSELQGKIAELEKQLAAVSNDKSVKYLKIMSIEEVRKVKSDWEEKLSAALAASNFDLCDEIQLELDFVENVLARRDLSEEARVARFQDLNAKFQQSIELKDFLTMAKLQLELNDLKDLVEEQERAAAEAARIKAEAEAAAAAKAAAEAEAAAAAKAAAEAEAAAKAAAEAEAAARAIAEAEAAARAAAEAEAAAKAAAEAEAAAKAAAEAEAAARAAAEAEAAARAAAEAEAAAKAAAEAEAAAKAAAEAEAAAKAAAEAEAAALAAAKRTRKELVAMKKEKEIEIEAALKAKSYVLCDNLNKELEKIIEDLNKMPTLADVTKQIAELEKKLKELIASKQYAQCEDVEKELERLKELKTQLLQEKEEESTDEEEEEENKFGTVSEQPKIVPQKRGSIIKVAGADATPTKPVVVKNEPKKPVVVATPAPKPKVTGNISSSASAVTTNTRRSSVVASSVPTSQSVKPTDSSNEGERPVSKLRPKAPVTAKDTNNLLEVAKKMAASRVDAALLLDGEGGLSGIITDNDITRRVVSQFVDPSATTVDSVMTRNPKCVHSDESALDALEMMVDNRFRHLPVLDKDGAVVGLLDIAKCLYDAISVLEKVHDKDEGKGGAGGADTTAALAQVMTAAMKGASGGRGNNAAQLLAMQAMMEQMFGGSAPTLRKIIGKSNFPSVRETVNVREASALMTQHRKGLLVLDDEGELIGIITPKDVLMRVLAQNKSPDLTAVFSVMTPNPECVSADLTVLDALREMHDQKFLHLPVRENDGRVIGLVDVMDLISQSAGGEGGKGWRDFFRDAMKAREDNNINDDDISDTFSRVESLKPTAPLPIRAKYLMDNSSDVFSLSLDRTDRDHTRSLSAIGGPGKPANKEALQEFDFKIADRDGHIHKIKCVPDSIDRLKEAVAAKLELPAESFLLKYIDDEKDEVLLNSDASLKDAVESARVTGSYSLKLTAVDNPKYTAPAAAPAAAAAPSSSASAPAPAATGSAPQQADNGGMNMGLIIGGGALVAGLAIVAFVFSRKK